MPSAAAAADPGRRARRRHIWRYRRCLLVGTLLETIVRIASNFSQLHIALVGRRAAAQGQSARALQQDLHTDALGRVPCRHGRSTIEHRRRRRPGSRPFCGEWRNSVAARRITVRLLRWQVEVMLMEPEQRLSRAFKFLDPVEDQRDRGLHAPIRILLEAWSRGLPQSSTRGRRRRVPPRRGLLVASGKRALAQKIKLVLVEDFP